MWALLRKEFIENVRWLPLAMLLTSTMTIMPVYNGWVSDISPMIANFLFGTSLLALGCGLLQSIPDERNSSRAYLLHRGVSAGQVFWAKSLIAFLLVSVAVVVPLTLCGWWLARRGVLVSPGRPIQMLPPALIALGAWTFYPTVLLIIYRPARWLGSRVVPILVPILMLWYCHTQLDGAASAKQLAIVLFLSLSVISVMLIAARRAYVDLARLPAASSQAHRAPVNALVLLASMLGVCMVSSIFAEILVGLGRSAPRVNYNTYLNENDGQFWLVRFEFEWQENQFGIKVLSGSPLVEEVMPNLDGTVPADFKIKLVPRLQLSNVSYYSPFYEDIAYCNCDSPFSNQRYNCLWDKRGYILLYEKVLIGEQRLAKIIGRDGIRDPRSDWGHPLDGLQSIQNNIELGLLADRRGVVQLDEETGRMLTVMEDSVERGQLWAGMGERLRLYVATSTQLYIYEVHNASGAIVPFPTEERVPVVGPFKFVRIDQFDLPPRLAQLATLEVDYRGPGHLLLHGRGGVGAAGAGTIGYIEPGRPAMEVFTISAPPEIYAWPSSTVAVAAVMKPPAPSLLAPLITYLTSGKRQHKSLPEVAFVRASSLPWIIAMFVLQGVVAMVLTGIVAKRRSHSRNAAMIWCGLALGLGWAVPLTVLAYYPRIVRDVCSHCHKLRRVDLAFCDHCHGTWERQQRQGVEIIEREFESVGAT